MVAHAWSPRGGGGMGSKSSRSSLSILQVWGQPGLHNTLPSSYKSHIPSHKTDQENGCRLGHQESPSFDVSFFVLFSFFPTFWPLRSPFPGYPEWNWLKMVDPTHLSDFFFPFCFCVIFFFFGGENLDRWEKIKICSILYAQSVCAPGYFLLWQSFSLYLLKVN